MGRIKDATHGIRTLKAVGDLLALSVRERAPSPTLRQTAEELARLAGETLALVAASDRRRPALIGLPARVRAFLKCVDDGWEGERLEASAGTVVQAVRDL